MKAIFHPSVYVLGIYRLLRPRCARRSAKFRRDSFRARMVDRAEPGHDSRHALFTSRYFFARYIYIQGFYVYLRRVVHFFFTVDASENGLYGTRGSGFGLIEALLRARRSNVHYTHRLCAAAHELPEIRFERHSSISKWHLARVALAVNLPPDVHV